MFHLEKAIFVNRAPFDKLELDFADKEIAVLCAANGKGKTTIISHIVDAIHELAKPHFYNEFENKQNKYYRISSSIYNLNMGLPSYVYLRFRFENEIIDYLDVRTPCTEEQYNSAISLAEKIPFHLFSSSLMQHSGIKIVSLNYSIDKAKLLFNNNLLTYFPAYRLSIPGYLNDPYKTKLNFKKNSDFDGYLPNPIESLTNLPNLLNWIMDIVLDKQQGYDQTLPIFNSINLLINGMLASKNLPEVRLGVGPRNYGEQRIQLVDVATQNTVYPSLFNLSSGETALLAIFSELLKQSDKCRNGLNLENISGIVLIDEVEKHLHIKLQKEVLPKLLNTFPNVQFIISSQSPFLSMGLAEESPARSKIVDLENLGITKNPEIHPLYQEVYEMMIHENDRFKEMYQTIKNKIVENEIPLIVTEGKTDVSHLKKAKEKLTINQELEFFEIFEDWGDSKLELLLDQLSKVANNRKIIGIFDRDVPRIVARMDAEANNIKNYGNNVYAFCIPTPVGKENYENISIEFYYQFQHLLKEKDGKRLYFSNELEIAQSASIRSQKSLKKLTTPNLAEENIKRIYDSDIGALDWIHSKARFADLVSTDEDFISDFDFTSFHLIFDKISLIVSS